MINHQGELCACKITLANTDERQPVNDLTQDMLGKLFADKGYIDKKLFKQLLERGLQLVTGIRKNMNNRLMPLFDKLMLRKRSLIESANNQPKSVFHLEHSRHRSPFCCHAITCCCQKHRSRRFLMIGLRVSIVIQMGQHTNALIHSISDRIPESIDFQALTQAFENLGQNEVPFVNRIKNQLGINDNNVTDLHTLLGHVKNHDIGQDIEESQLAEIFRLLIPYSAQPNLYQNFVL